MKHKVMNTIFSILILTGVMIAFWIGGTIINGSGSDTPAFHQPPNYLIVLGCRLEGESPGSCLTERIDAAAEYLKAHPDCYAVASGGQGADEVISEAEAIARALKKRGIDPKRILKEERSTSTIENFSFAKELLDEREQGNPYFLAFVTNDFHVYRARKLAEKAGFSTPIAVSAKSSAVNFYLNLPREILAVLAQIR